VQDARLRVSDLDGVVLSAARPACRSCGPWPRGCSAASRSPASSPTRTVALGAALQAGFKARDEALSEIVLTDTSPHSLGVAVAVPDEWGEAGHLEFSPILERNTVIPRAGSSPTGPFTTRSRKVQIDVYQGESRRLEANVRLGSLSLPLPPGKAREREVLVRFTYDINGLLEVDTRVAGTEVRRSLVIEGNPGSLSPEEVKTRLRALQSLKVHPREQMENRTLLARGDRLFENRSARSGRSSRRPWPDSRPSSPARTRARSRGRARSWPASSTSSSRGRRGRPLASPGHRPDDRRASHQEGVRGAAEARSPGGRRRGLPAAAGGLEAAIALARWEALHRDAPADGAFPPGPPAPEPPPWLNAPWAARVEPTPDALGLADAVTRLAGDPKTRASEDAWRELLASERCGTSTRAAPSRPSSSGDSSRRNSFSPGGLGAARAGLHWNAEALALRATLPPGVAELLLERRDEAPVDFASRLCDEGRYVEARAVVRDVVRDSRSWPEGRRASSPGARPRRRRTLW